MRIGVDGSKIPHEADDSAIRILERAHGIGMEGVYFRSVLDVSPTLDRGFLTEVRECAESLDLYLQMGLAKVNPYAASEAPHVRRLGDGDYTRGMVKMIEAAHEAAGVTDLWVACANYQRGLPGYYVFDRFRTDAPWADQLVAIEKFLRLLAPVARDHGVHLNIETHEEITSYEIVRLIEAVGDDVLGVTFDTANVVVRGEDPVAAARRVAPYTRATHLRDFVLGEQDGVFGRVFAPIGQGSLDWDAILGILHAENPDLPLSIENAGPTLHLPIGLDDPEWIAKHPDLDPQEVARIREMAAEYAERVERGEAQSLDVVRATPYDGAHFIDVSATALRDALSRIGATV
ncbi:MULTISPECIES: sugar phosphate isomerase/epimerase [Arthrobacter]|uniref:Sugar phosphate isomerase/epimerase n=1 Tax=Arthrobacter terricola TaxID=2547396 RepID=A0A4R5KZV7_9MICC|nr:MULTISPECIES: sugar phosphate isomerase/epimerase family protein [Arthrobacter]MBT8159012.1 sugar phosphate isomerase/epimerase [Arthrobacter sp. GN70]TDG01678.1 sugar phosphate isomerase/epimerase [Arthrobacter terricola]